MEPSRNWSAMVKQWESKIASTTTRTVPRISIREMALDDLAQVYHLGERLFTKELYPFLYSSWDKREVVGHFNTEPGLSLVADVDGELAGFIIGSLITKTSRIYGYIIWLGVDSRFQSLGVAHELYGRVALRMAESGAHQIVVDTDASNTGAIRFFSKKGFRDEREHVVLTLSLGGAKKAAADAGVKDCPECELRPRAARRSWKNFSAGLRSWNRIATLTSLVHGALFGPVDATLNANSKNIK